MVNFNNHNESIISQTTFDFFVDQAAAFFPALWKHLFKLRNVKGKYRPSDKAKEPAKRQQVFL